MEVAFWPIFCTALAYMQGVLMPAIRRTPPGKEADRQSFGLHWVGSAAYFMPIALEPTWKMLLLALAVRVVLFDVVLNLTAGSAPFAVGRTALTDRLLRRVAPAHPEWVSGAVKLAIALGLVGWLLA